MVHKKEMIFLLKKFFREHKSIFWFSGFLVMASFYYLSKLLPKDYNFIHTYLDDKIPFLPIFVIPYSLWYIYVPLMMLFVFLKDENAFKRQAITFFSGALFCSLIFLIFPSAIDFRPTAEGDGILLRMTRIIYAFDVPPANVFPSLHCYEALAVHLTAFTYGPYKNKKLFRILSFVLVAVICASTVFIKQHSIVDVIAGIAVALIFCGGFKLFLRGNKNEFDNETV